MNQQTENRRHFSKRASVVAVAFPLLPGCKSDTLAKDEPMIISGTVFQSDGKTPARTF